MSNIGDDIFRQEMISLTANKEWQTLVKDIEAEIYHNQCAILDSATTWDQVVFAKGWNKCLAYIANLRPRIEMELKQAEGDTNAEL